MYLFPVFNLIAVIRGFIFNLGWRYEPINITTVGWCSSGDKEKVWEKFSHESDEGGGECGQTE